MKPELRRVNEEYDRRRPQTPFSSWAVSIMVFGFLIALGIQPVLQRGHSAQQTCTVIIDCLKEPVIFHTNSTLHHAVVVTLKTELKFIERLIQKFA
jgi:hypothetical protein